MKEMIRSICILLMCSSSYATIVPALSGFQGVWYSNGANTPYGPKYAGATATYPQQVAPFAVYRPEVNKTFFTFTANRTLLPGLGRPLGHAVSWYDHTTGLLAEPRLWFSGNSTDSHDAPSISIDDDGYIYLASSTHGEVRQSYISKSLAPYDITSIENLLDDPDDNTAFGALFGDPSSTPPRFSYGSLWWLDDPNGGDDELLLTHTRYVNGQRDLFTSISNDGDVWSPRIPTSAIESGQYQTTWVKPDGSTLGTIFNVHPFSAGATPSDMRSDLYYIETPDASRTWRTAGGDVLLTYPDRTPFSSRPQEALVYASQQSERVYLKDVNYSQDGSPIILFLTSDDHNPGPANRMLKVARWSVDQWIVSDVVQTDHNYDHGSIYVKPDGSYEIVGPFVVGPQGYATGGEIGVWRSDDSQTWKFDDLVTYDSVRNHSYVRRPLNADDDFYAMWGSANSISSSRVEILFSDSDFNVLMMPYNITQYSGTDSIWLDPINLVSPIAVSDVPFRLPGDYNLDGIVDIADYSVWRDARLSAEDDALYWQWSLNFGNMVASPISIPEPCSLVTIIIMTLLPIRKLG